MFPVRYSIGRPTMVSLFGGILVLINGETSQETPLYGARPLSPIFDGLYKARRRMAPLGPILTDRQRADSVF